MPIVRPDIENRVSLRPVTDAKVRAADFGQDTYGRAIAQAGAQLSDVADQWERINVVYDEAAAKRVDNEAMLRLGELRRKAMSTKGFDAQAARTDYEEQARKIKDELAGNLKNDRQKFLFTTAYDSRFTADLDRIANHADSEVRTAAIGESTARATNFKDRAIDMRDDPEEFERSLTTGENEIRSAAALQGMGEADTALAVAKYRSGVYTSAAEAIDDVLEKEDYINRNASSILPEDETRLRQKIKPALGEARLDVAEGMVLEELGLIRAERAAETFTGQPGDQPDDAPLREQQEQVAATRSDPLRGKGRKTSDMGARKDPFTGQTRTHAGADYAAPEGTPVFPVAPGKVIEAGPKGGYGNYVKVQHADGRVTAYAHLRNINVKKGETIDAEDVIGGVGSTGRSTGPHLHLEVFGPNGKRVDPETQKWAVGDLPRYKPDRVDKEEYYEAARRIAIRENMDMAQYNGLLRRMDAHVARQDDLLQREEEAQRRIAEEAVAAIEATGGELTSVEQIPNFGSLPASTQSAYRNLIKQNRAEAAKVEAYGDTFLTLDEMASRADTQDQFLTLNIDEFADRLTKAERGRLKKMQNDIRTGGGAQSRVAVEKSRVRTMINQYAPDVGIETGNSTKAKSKENRARAAKLQSLVEAEVAEEQRQKNRPLTDPELDAIVRKNVAPVLVKEAGFFGQREVEKPFFELRGVAGARGRPTMPASIQRKIIADYKAVYGRNPSLEQQLDIYYRAYPQ